MRSHTKIISQPEHTDFLSAQRTAIINKTGHYQHIRPLHRDDDPKRIERLRAELLKPHFGGNVVWKTIKNIPYIIEISLDAIQECLGLIEFNNIALLDCCADEHNEKFIARVYEKNGTVLGFACAAKKDDGWSIYDSIIDEDHRGNGIGTAMICQLLFEMNKKALQPVYMYVDSRHLGSILEKTGCFTKRSSFLTTRGKRSYWVMD